MLDFFEYGEMLLEAIADVGDFLLTSPAPVDSGATELLISWLNAAGFTDVANWVQSWYYPDITFAAMVFGSGIVTFLVIRFIKFWTDIFN